jgi:hypothetical protein
VIISYVILLLLNMKLFITVCLAFVLVSCHESNVHDTTDTVSSSRSNPNDPFKDLDPEHDNRDEEKTTADVRADEKWYGLDSEDDTVVYEKDGKILTNGYVTGTFERMDRGDFMHFVMRDSNGYLHSFFMNTGNQRQMDKYFEGYEPARGHPVTVKWIRGPLQVSDGGTMVTLYQAKEIIE